MIAAAWILALGLLAVLFENLLERERNPNQQLAARTAAEGTREVTLQRNRYGHYVVTGLLNGEPVELMLDTGASDVSIPEQIAERLGLERGAPTTYQTANGLITAYATTVGRIQVGDIVVHNVRASINPRGTDEAVLLGMSFLKELEFTQRGDRLILKQYGTD